MIKDAISERQSDIENVEERKTNIIVFNAPESEANSTEDRKLDDKAFFVETCNYFCDRNIPSTDILQTCRLGKRSEGKGTRPLLIKLKSEMTKRIIFSQLHKLRNNESLSTFSMNHDMTKEERVKTKLLVEEAKQPNYLLKKQNDKPKISWRKVNVMRHKKLGSQGAGSPVEPGNPKGTSKSAKSAMISTTNNVYLVQNINNLNTKYNKYMSTPDTNMSPKKKADQLLLLIVNFQNILGKKEEIELMLLDNKIDIVLGSETHLKPHISDNEFLHPSYTCYRRDRDDGFGGAIIITGKDLIVEEIVKSETCEFLAIQIQTHSQPLILATAYRPPSSPLEGAVNVSNELIKLNKIQEQPDMIWGRHELARYQLEDKFNNKAPVPQGH